MNINDPSTNLSDLAKQMVEIENKESEKRTKVEQRIDSVADSAKGIIAPYKAGMVFNYFRYALAFLLIAMKLGMFTYLSVNPLADTSWWLVLLPAYAVEAAMVGVAIVAIVIMLIILAMSMIGTMVVSFIRARNINKKVEELRAHNKRVPPTNDEVELMERFKSFLHDYQPPLDN